MDTGNNPVSDSLAAQILLRLIALREYDGYVLAKERGAIHTKVLWAAPPLNVDPEAVRACLQYYEIDPTDKLVDEILKGPKEPLI